MLTLKDLKEAGYREEHIPSKIRGEDFFLQKTITNSKGTKLYFIDVLVYKFPTQVDGRSEGFAPLCQFYVADKAFNVELMEKLENQTVASMEAFFESVYQQMHCRAYDEV